MQYSTHNRTVHDTVHRTVHDITGQCSAVHTHEQCSAVHTQDITGQCSAVHTHEQCSAVHTHEQCSAVHTHDITGQCRALLDGHASCRSPVREEFDNDVGNGLTPTQRIAAPHQQGNAYGSATPEDALLCVCKNATFMIIAAEYKNKINVYRV